MNKRPFLNTKFSVTYYAYNYNYNQESSFKFTKQKFCNCYQLNHLFEGDDIILACWIDRIYFVLLMRNT